MIRDRVQAQVQMDARDRALAGLSLNEKRIEWTLGQKNEL